MKWFIFKASVLLCAAVWYAPQAARADGGVGGERTEMSAREHREEKYREWWNRLIPRYSKLQFYGGMGIASLGVGWDYGRKKQWETDVFVGFLPKYSASRASATFTLKQNYIPWTLPLSPSGRWTVSPLQTGLYFNKLTSREFWGREPEKYGGPYYRFATNLRISIYAGQRITYHFTQNHRHKSVSFFYEFSTNDLYLFSALTNRSISPGDILVLSFGLKLQFL